MDLNLGQLDSQLRRNLIDPIAHRDCLAVFADSIDKLHELAPGSWSTYCKGTKLRLVGGPYIVLTYNGGRVWITLDQHALEADASARAHLTNTEGVEFDKGRWAHYRRPFPTTNVFYSPTEASEHTRALIQELHFAVLERVARYSLRPDSRRKHQPGISRWLSAALGRFVPDAEGMTPREAGNVDPHQAVERMVATAERTVLAANGQEVTRKMKNKDLCFSKFKFLEYVRKLVQEQHGLCAVSGIPLQFDGAVTDPELTCSLDRIDSAGHYEPGNLQVVCRFINRWKGDTPNAEFRRLIELVRRRDADVNSEYAGVSKG